VTNGVAERGIPISPATGRQELADIPVVVSSAASTAEIASSRVPLGRILKLSLTAAFCLAVLLTVAVRTSSWRKSLVAGAPVRVQSIAVLPLENLSGDPSQEYFADGMTDALITKLAGIRKLRVISRTSTVLYKGTRKTLPEIARELNVDA